jgi:hypothetical protein
VSALSPALRSSLAAQLDALDASLAPVPPPAPRVFSTPPVPEAPTVTLPLSVALEAQGALYRYAAQLEAAAKATHGPTSDDVAAAYMRAGSASVALEAMNPLVEAARQENRRRHAEHREEWLRRQRTTRGGAA